MQNNSKRMKKTLFVFIVLDVLTVMLLIFLYSPINIIRDTWICTAMNTRTHQYLARIFYSEEAIKKVMSRNYFVETDESTDVSAINRNNKEILAENKAYEKAILTKDSENDLYKIIDIQGNNYKGWLVVIYDSKRVSLVASKTIGTRGQRLTEMSKEHKALVGINASGFFDDGIAGNAMGYVIVDNKIVHSGDYTSGDGGMIGINNDGVLVLSKLNSQEAVKQKIKYAVQFSPYLIVNGESMVVGGNGGGGINPRTAIGQRKDGIMLFLIIDGRRAGYSLGASYKDEIAIMKRYGAYNAANLDGGSTTTMTVDGVLYNRPTSSSATGEKKIPDAWILK